MSYQQPPGPPAGFPYPQQAYPGVPPMQPYPQQAPAPGYAAQPETHAGGTVAITDTTGSYEGVQYKIDHRDSNSLLSLKLHPEYVVKGRPGSMVAMDASVKIRGKVG